MVLVSSGFVHAQPAPVYVNAPVDADQKTTIEDRSAELAQVASVVKELVYCLPFVPDRNVVYRVFGDKDLPMGIMAVEKEMNRGSVTRQGENVTSWICGKLVSTVRTGVRKAEKLDLRAVEIDPE